MALKPLNSIAGFSVGSTGNIVIYSNLDIAGSNITATNGLNGSSLTVNGISNLNSISNVRITGGSSGQSLITDGLGNLSFANAVSNVAAPMPYFIPTGKSYIVPDNFQGLFATPIEIDGDLVIDGQLIDVSRPITAANNQILFAEANYAVGNSGFTFDSTSGNLSVPGNITSSGNLLPNANVTYSIGSPNKRWNNIYLAGNTIFLGNASFSIDESGAIQLLNGTGGELLVAGNANVTTLESGNSNITITTNGNIITSVAGTPNVFVITNTGANLSGTLNATGNITAPNFIGNISGNVSAPGSNTQVIFNNDGKLGASNAFTFSSATNVFTVTGNIVANNANLGNLVSANYLVSNSGCVMVSTGAISVDGSNAGIFNASVSNINLGLAANNITVGSNTSTVTFRNDVDVNGVLDSPSIMVGDLYSRRTAIPITSANTVIDSFPIADFRTAKYTLRASSDIGYQALEVLLVHNDINSIVTIYGSLSTANVDIVSLTTAIVSGNVELRATGFEANTRVNLMGTYVPD